MAADLSAARLNGCPRAGELLAALARCRCDFATLFSIYGRLRRRVRLGANAAGGTQDRAPKRRHLQTTLLGLAIAFIIALVAALIGPYFID